jgi:hypothetical protein
MEYTFYYSRKELIQEKAETVGGLTTPIVFTLRGLLLICVTAPGPTIVGDASLILLSMAGTVLLIELLLPGTLTGITLTLRVAEALPPLPSETVIRRTISTGCVIYVGVVTVVVAPDGLLT